MNMVQPINLQSLNTYKNKKQNKKTKQKEKEKKENSRTRRKQHRPAAQWCPAVSSYAGVRRGQTGNAGLKLTCSREI